MIKENDEHIEDFEMMLNGSHIFALLPPEDRIVESFDVGSVLVKMSDQVFHPLTERHLKGGDTLSVYDAIEI
jgi:hypothetical protein